MEPSDLKGLTFEDLEFYPLVEIWPRYIGESLNYTKLFDHFELKMYNQNLTKKIPFVHLSKYEKFKNLALKGANRFIPDLELFHALQLDDQDKWGNNYHIRMFRRKNSTNDAEA